MLNQSACETTYELSHWAANTLCPFYRFWPSFVKVKTSYAIKRRISSYSGCQSTYNKFAKKLIYCFLPLAAMSFIVFKDNTIQVDCHSLAQTLIQHFLKTIVWRASVLFLLHIGVTQYWNFNQFQLRADSASRYRPWKPQKAVIAKSRHLKPMLKDVMRKAEMKTVRVH